MGEKHTAYADFRCETDHFIDDYAIQIGGNEPLRVSLPQLARIFELTQD